jgi:integrase
MVEIRRRNLKWGDINMAELEMNRLILHFAQSNKAERKSPKTVSWYTEMLTDFAKFLERTSRRPVLAEFNVEAVREFVVHEQGRGMSPYTVQGKVRALKAFASWLFNEGYTSDHLLLNLRLPKTPVNLIEPLTHAEIDQLLHYQSPLTAIGCRNAAMLVLMLDTGLRVSELCGLRFEDTHIEEGYLKVMGKGAKDLNIQQTLREGSNFSCPLFAFYTLSFLNKNISSLSKAPRALAERPYQLQGFPVTGRTPYLTLFPVGLGSTCIPYTLSPFICYSPESPFYINRFPFALQCG